MKLHSCLNLGTVPCYASSVWVYDGSWVDTSVKFMVSVFT